MGFFGCFGFLTSFRPLSFDMYGPSLLFAVYARMLIGALYAYIALVRLNVLAWFCGDQQELVR